jgi:myo-inositol 2-dehydrogenase/D-chiro-inositol 1-dehydrogenase
MTPRRLEVAVIGCGDIAVAQHLPALRRDERFEVVAVTDTVRERAERAAAQFSVPRVVDGVEQALALGPHAVVIATPPHVSPLVAGQALAAGAHVLCEKPIAVTLETAEELVEQVEATGLVFQVGFKNRFSPLTQGLRRLVANGRLGEPLLIRIGAFDEAYRPTDELHTSRIRGFLAQGPPIVHDGAHAADLLNWLLGPPTMVSATSHRNRPSFPAPNYHCAAIEYADGSLAKLEVGWWFPHMLAGEVHVYGPDGVADLSRPGGYLRFYDGRELVEDRSAEDWQTVCFRGQLDAFHEAIAGGPQRGADVEAGRDALGLTLAVVEAAERRKPVRYPTRVA